jgi:hypothetical protein
MAQVTLDDLRRIALALPGMEEGTSYGTPGFRVRGKLVARLWPEGDVLVLHVGAEERAALIATNPAVYFLTDHYRGSGMVLVHLTLASPDELAQLFAAAWRALAPKRLLAEYFAQETTDADRN